MITSAEIKDLLDRAEAAFRDMDHKMSSTLVRLLLTDFKEDSAAKSNYEPQSLVQLAWLLINLGTNYADNAYEQAQAVLDKALDWYRDSTSVDLLFEQGWLHYDWSHFDQALVTFQKLKQACSAPAQKTQKLAALQGAAASLRRLRRFREAEEVLGEALAVAETPTVELLIERGWLLFYQGRFELAFAEFMKVLGRPDAKETDEYKARTGMLASRQAAAKQNPAPDNSNGDDLLGGWVIGPPGISRDDALDILHDAAVVHERLNNYEAALLARNLMLKFDPDNEKAHELKIYALKWLRRFEAAKQAYQTARERLPYSIDVWNEMGHTHYQQKHYSRARDYFTGAAATPKEFPYPQKREEFVAKLQTEDYAVEWHIILLRKMYDFAAAEKRVDEALAQFGSKVNFLSEKAVLYFTRQDYSAAIEVFDRALKVDAYDEFANQWRAASYRKQRDFAKATEGIMKALEKLPVSSGLCEERAWIAFDQGKLNDADKYFAEAIKLDPYLIRTQFSRVEVLSRLKRNDEALQVFQKLESMFPKDLEVAEQLGWFYLRRGQLDEARQQFSFIEKNDPENVLGINGLGGYYLEQRDFTAAEAQFRKALAQVDYEPQYYINLAWSLIRQGHECLQPADADKLLREAEVNCRTALEKDPFNAKAYICLGVIAFKRNDFTGAEGYFRRSLELDPIDGGRVELGALYVQTARLDEAKQELSEAIKTNANDARAHFEMANLLLLEDDNKGAVRECYLAILLDPNNEEAQLALAIALKRAGRSDEAEKALRNAIKRLPPAKHWQLYLQLAEIMVELGDANKDRNFYEEALRHVNYALLTHPASHADIAFHAGIVHYRLEEYKTAYKDFQECLKLNQDRFDAQRYSQAVKALIRQDRRISRINIWGGVGIAGFCSLLLVILWTGYFLGWKKAVAAAPAASATTKPQTEPKANADTTADSSSAATAAAANDQNSPNSASNSAPADTSETAANAEPVNNAATSVSDEAADSSAADATDGSEAKTTQQFLVDQSMLTVMTPLLLGLLVVGLLLPNLNKLKLPGGFEAEIGELKPQETKEPVSSGPKGDIGFGSSLPVLSPGPGGR